MTTTLGSISAFDMAGLVRAGYMLPGPHDTHLSVVILYEDVDGERLYYVIEYDSGEGTQIKFTGGTNKDHTEENPFDTARREGKEETYLTLPERIECIWIGRRTQNKGVPGYHQKLAFLVDITECTGTMRTVPANDDDGDKHSPPFPRTAEELLVRVEDGGLFYSHRPMLEAALKHAA